MRTQQEIDETQIRQQIDRMVEAIRVGDLDVLKQIYATDIVSFDVQPPLQHLGAQAKERNWVDVYTIYETPIDYQIRELSITVGGEVAFVHGINRLSGTLKNGQVAKGIWVRWTGCLQKIDGAWVISHDHVSTPLDFSSGRALVDLEP